MRPSLPVMAVVATLMAAPIVLFSSSPVAEKVPPKQSAVASSPAPDSIHIREVVRRPARASGKCASLLQDGGTSKSRESVAIKHFQWGAILIDLQLATFASTTHAGRAISEWSNAIMACRTFNENQGGYGTVSYRFEREESGFKIFEVTGSSQRFELFAAVRREGRVVGLVAFGSFDRLMSASEVSRVSRLVDQQIAKFQ